MKYYTYLDSDEAVMVLFSQAYILLFESEEDLQHEAEIQKIFFAGILIIDDVDVNHFIMHSAMVGNVVFYRNGNIHEKR